MRAAGVWGAFGRPRFTAELTGAARTRSEWFGLGSGRLTSSNLTCVSASDRGETAGDREAARITDNY